MSLPPPLPPPDGFICQGLFYEVGDVDEHCTQPHHNKWAEDQMREYGELCRKMALEEAAKFCESQKFMVLDPFRTRTADEVCRSNRAVASSLAKTIRELAK